MRRRLLAAFAALALLVVGSVILLTYVRGADARALAGTRTVEVLVADELIPRGTPGSELADLVRHETLPAKAALEGRVTDISALTGRVTTVDLQPGEQLLTSRFESPDDLQAAGTVAVPAGAQEVSILLEPQRAIGGRLAAGDTVGVVVSATLTSGPATHAVMHDVLVTQVQGAPAREATDEVETASAGAAAPSASLMVTLAVSAAQAEAVVFAAEHGSVWLTLQPDGTDTRGTGVITPDSIYGGVFS